jgi:hypothetical protein
VCLEKRPERREAMVSARFRMSVVGGVLAAVGLFGQAPALFAEEAGGRQCSVRTLDGKYGFYRTGKGAFGGPLAGMGIADFDGNGNWTALVTNVRDGDVTFDEEFSGTYAIAGDCTGSIFVEETELERIVIVDDGKTYYGVNVLGGPTIYLVATRIHAGRATPRER